MAPPIFPNDKNYDWTGGEQDQYGFSESLPGHQYAPQQQFAADKITRARQEMFYQQAEQSQREGLGNLSTYRPGGAAAMTSPFYSNMSNVLVSRAQAQYSPDLMHYWRWNQAHRARKAGKRAATIGAIGAAVGGILPVVGNLISGLGGAGKAAATPPDASQFSGGMGLSTDVPAPTTGAMQGPAGLPPTAASTSQPGVYGASEGGVPRETGQPQMPQGGGGTQQPQPGAPQQPGQQPGGPGAPGAPGSPQMAMGGIPPTEHPLGFQFGMAANLGSDIGIPNDQMLAMTMMDEDVGGPDGVPMLDFAETQLDQMFFTLHEIMRGDPSLGGYL